MHCYKPVKTNSNRGFFTDATILRSWLFTLHDIFTAFKNGTKFNREIELEKQTDEGSEIGKIGIFNDGFQFNISFSFRT